MKLITSINQAFNNSCIRLSVGVATLFAPLASFAADQSSGPTNPMSGWNPFKTGDDPVKAAGNVVEEGLKYLCIIIGVIIILGAAGYIWHSVNMTHEEKEKHNVAVRIIMGVVGIFLALGLIALAFTYLSNGG